MLSSTSALASRAFLELSVLPVDLRGLATWVRGTGIYNPPILFSKTRTRRLVQLPALREVKPRTHRRIPRVSRRMNPLWVGGPFSACGVLFRMRPESPAPVTSRRVSRSTWIPGGTKPNRTPSRTFRPLPRERGRFSRPEMPPSTRISVRSRNRSRTFASSVRPASLFIEERTPRLGHLPRTKPKLLPSRATRRRLPTCAARHDPRTHPRVSDLEHRIERC